MYMILEEYLYPCFYEKMGKKELNLKEKKWFNYFKADIKRTMEQNNLLCLLPTEV